MRDKTNSLHSPGRWTKPEVSLVYKCVTGQRSYFLSILVWVCVLSSLDYYAQASQETCYNLTSSQNGVHEAEPKQGSCPCKCVSAVILHQNKEGKNSQPRNLRSSTRHQEEQQNMQGEKKRVYPSKMPQTPTTPFYIRLVLTPAATDRNDLK